MSTLYRFIIAITFFVATASVKAQDNANRLNREILQQTNTFRKEKGLPPLIINNNLNSIAQQHSENMAEGKVAFGHDGFGQRNEMAKASISSVTTYGENVAYGATTAKDVVTLWKNSPGHRRNLLGRFTYIGIGIAKDKEGRMYYTQFFAG
ncbi:MAG: CAP domain-containing protein [Bacteroidetes bacterium]|nr:CAP domain-containing protein [Bacteroidota bacterium]